MGLSSSYTNNGESLTASFSNPAINLSTFASPLFESNNTFLSIVLIPEKDFTASISSVLIFCFSSFLTFSNFPYIFLSSFVRQSKIDKLNIKNLLALLTVFSLITIPPIYKPSINTLIALLNQRKYALFSIRIHSVII